ncbi:unnamed protein product [Kuraishia capsulata CBS 1993]|uniref:TAP42-like protein n=1 Tax=Kuraishia capsulata CBS 1993 TaxID=1382522 RepID=W6MHQ5_9ASCO|nr:uncharacterized protein KUCA_T00001491001 [Kuraishia capsulata CBS 1993]CDK25521.1 unnamed protein product [Kuraishia capsulata CBS 1993]
MSQVPLSQRFVDVVHSVKKLESSSLRKDSKAFQDQLSETINDLESVKKTIQQLAMFSTNEEIEEVNTKDIQYLAIDFYLARALENSTKLRQQALQTSQTLYIQFLHSLENYGLLDRNQQERLDNFKESFNPTLSELRPDDPVKRRELKIANFKAEKEFNLKLSVLNDPTTNLENMDDEVVREIYTDQLKLQTLQAFQHIEANMMELEVLKHMPQPRLTEVKELDDREREREGSREANLKFTDKLESLSQPLLSKQGKVLRPFTIVSDRKQLQKKVFGTGQELPSMTVEEYLDYELANGGMVKPQEPEKEVDEDDMEAADKETYEKRDWDEFVEANPKGSGNTANLG